MRIVVASGKGGTGKTTIATSLARSLTGGGEVWFMDCDVEAPNGHLFLKPVFERQAQASVLIPQILADRCTLCGKCIEVCQFHALAKVGKTIMVFPQLCHGCGSCSDNCPERAILEAINPIGQLEAGLTTEGIHFSYGALTISEPMPTPVIRQLKRFEHPPERAVVILDAPPGASCSVVETLRGADYALLVTEPSPFGLHDLKQMVAIVQEMGIPAGVVINRESEPYPALMDFCAQNHLPVLMRVPFERRIAEGVAKGSTLQQIDPRYEGELQQLFERIQSEFETARGSGI